jgi:hypothetical protein
MSKWSKEYKEQMKDKVRAILVRKPRISNYELSSLLGIDRNTAYFIREDILREVRESVSKEVILEEIGKFQQEIDALCLEAWDIITRNTREYKIELYDKDGKPSLNDKGEQLYRIEKTVISTQAKTRAMDLIGKLRNMILEAKFNAGLFKKDWGNLGIDKIFDEKYQKMNEAIDAIKKLRETKDADNGVQNREGEDVQTGLTGPIGV